MFKKVVSYYIAVTLLICCLFSTPVVAEKVVTNPKESVLVAGTADDAAVMQFKSKSLILVDATTGNVLLEKDPHKELPIASITKVMSMLIIMEAIDSGNISYNDIVQVSENAYSFGGSQVYLKPGEEFTVAEMLKAVAIHSANDATVALAEKVAGSEETFVSKMNEKAKQLGMKNTYFLDSSGLTDEGHYSTAYDIALMSRELINKHAKVLDFTSIWMDSFRDGEFELVNRNKLVRFYEGANGLKTGFTSKAGHCLAASAKRNNLQLISVVLGGPDSDTRFAESRKLLDYGFANFETIKFNSKGEKVQLIDVQKGLEPGVNSIFANDVNFLLKKGSKDKVEKTIKLPESVTAPVKAGQKLGEVVYKVNGKEIGKADLVAEKEVQKASFLKLLIRLMHEWFTLGRK